MQFAHLAFDVQIIVSNSNAFFLVFPFYVHLFGWRRLHSDDIEVRDIYVKEWKLVYSPQNSIFEELVDEAVKSLKLNGIVGVNTPEEVEAVMFNQELVAGINFQHLQVNQNFSVQI